MTGNDTANARRTERNEKGGPTFSALPANFVHVRTHAVPIDIDDSLNDSICIHHELAPYISPRTTMFGDLCAWCWRRSRSWLIFRSVTASTMLFDIIQFPNRQQCERYESCSR